MNSSHFIFLFQNCFGYSDSFSFPYKVKNNLVYIQEYKFENNLVYIQEYKFENNFEFKNNLVYICKKILLRF